jgi:hypothetical protein
LAETNLHSHPVLAQLPFCAFARRVRAVTRVYVTQFMYVLAPAAGGGRGAQQG